MTKKALALITSLLMIAMLLASCNSSSSSGSASGSDSTFGSDSQSQSDTGSDTDGEETVITVWIPGAEDSDPTVDFGRVSAWAAKFNEENAGRIRVEVSGNHHPPDILTVISAESTPDIFYNYWNNTPSWADAGAILDLTDYIANTPDYNIDDFLPYALEMAAHPDGRQFSIPWQVSTSALFYNIDMLEEAGFTEPPASLDEIVEMHRAITKIEDGRVVQAGITPDIPWLESIGWSVANGAYWADDEGNITFDTPEMRKTYDRLVEMFDIMGGYAAAQEFNSTLGKIGEPTDPLLNGKVAMLYLSDDHIPKFVEYGKEANWGLIPLPGDTGEGMLTIGTLAINAKTKNPDLAWEVLASMTSAETYIDFELDGPYHAGRTMARKSALEALADNDAYSDEVRTIAKSMLNSEMRGFAVSSYINEYLNSIAVEADAAITGEITVEQACKNVQEEVSKIAAER